MNREQEIHIQTNDDGSTEGVHPDSLTKEQYEELGIKAITMSKAVRLRCLDCCAGSSDEVRKCVSSQCSLWPYRMGRKPEAFKSQARKELGKQLHQEG